jgi:phosphoribosyl 1,2-cyclic phosphate phosphodiesterase
MSLRVTILGSGSSGGVPRIGNDWGVCDPQNRKNRRLRCSILVERFGGGPRPTRILIDTSPDMREQLLATAVGELDAVLMTHDHADQTHGLDDLRAVAFRIQARVPVYMDEQTSKQLNKRFG